MIPSETSGFYPYAPAALLKISGFDAATYLQGQFTNDIRTVKDGEAVYGLWLNHKGKVLADSFIRQETGGGAYIAVSYFSTAAVIRERLDAYVVADDVVIEDVAGEWDGVSVIGRNVEEFRPALPIGVLTFSGRRVRAAGFETLFPKALTAEMLAIFSSAGLKEITTAKMEWFRIADGIPAIPRDIGPGELPNEGGLETTAISYTKGCYLGQEVMARLKSMGQVRRRLLKVEMDDGKMPALPAPLFLGERKVGELRSVAAKDHDGFVGLALLSLMQVKSGVELSFAAGGAARVRVIDPQLLR